MSHELFICLIAVSVNLAGMLVIYSVMSHAFACLTWKRGSSAVVALIIVTQLFWIAPAIWIVEAQGTSRTGSYALWFGNWLVSGFAIVLFLKSAAQIPVALNDAARMDGLGSIATWRQTVLPFVRRDLIVLAVLTLMATLLPYWGAMNQPEANNIVTIFERSPGWAGHLIAMTVGSLVGSVPLVGILFIAKPRD